MRLSLIGLLSVLILAVVTLPAAAQNPDALKIIKVTATGFTTETGLTPADLSLKKGDFVRWEWATGSRTIVVSANPAGSEEPNVLVTFTISEEKKSYQLQFNETDTYFYYDPNEPDDARFSGIITVLEATPVNRTTWGFIKSLFR